jgi:prevent-host-death family protein
MGTRIMPVSDLRRKTSEVLNDLRDEENEVYVTRYGHPVAVLVDYEYYERLKELSEQAKAASLTESSEEQHHPRPGAQYPTVANPPSSLKNWHNLIPDGYEGDALADTEALYDEV